MYRYSVIYQFKKQYHQIFCETHSEANAVLRQLYAKKKKHPVGIYDAKTELFSWETIRQQHFDRLPVEEQGRLGNEIITVAQTLRDRDGNEHLNGGVLQSDILQRPVYQNQ